MPKISLEVKYQVWALSEQKHTQVYISQKLYLPPSSVSRIINKRKKTGTFSHSRGNGRSLKMNESIAKINCREIKKNPKLSLRKLSFIIKEETGNSICFTTIKRYLNKNNMFAFSPIKKPLLTKRHEKQRFEASKKWIFMNEEDTRSIIFSDESKFNLFYIDGKIKVWREPKKGLKNKNLVPTIKHGGGSIMLWGCFSYYGVGNLVVIKGKMNAAKYIDILAKNLFISAEKMNLNSFIFQQDNDPKHTSKLANEFFEERGVDLLPWPPQSPDMNPIEHIWGLLKSRINERRPKSLKELEQFAVIEWNT